MDTGPTKWLTSEFGAALAIMIGVTAFVFWRARSALPAPDLSLDAPMSTSSQMGAVPASR